MFQLLIVGSVPDRGGRANEMRPKAPPGGSQGYGGRGGGGEVRQGNILKYIIEYCARDYHSTGHHNITAL